MTKTTCDICGKEMGNHDRVKLVYELNFCISSYGKMWDVCSKCREELNDWINQHKPRNRPSCKYYTDGYCENLELQPCYPMNGCDEFERKE